MVIMEVVLTDGDWMIRMVFPKLKNSMGSEMLCLLTATSPGTSPGTKVQPLPSEQDTDPWQCHCTPVSCQHYPSWDGHGLHCLRALQQEFLSASAFASMCCTLKLLQHTNPSIDYKARRGTSNCLIQALVIEFQAAISLFSL